MSRRIPRRNGRPSLLTPDVQQRLLDAVSSGVPVTHATTFAGIGQTTFERWMQRGRDAQDLADEDQPVPADEEPYRLLWEQVSRARSVVAVRNVAIVAKAAEGGYVTKERTRRYRDPGNGLLVTETETDYAPPEWQASRWLLEKSFHRDFGRTAQQVELTGEAGGPVQFEHGVTPEVADIAARLREFASRRVLELPSTVLEGEVVEDRVAS